MGMQMYLMVGFKYRLFSTIPTDDYLSDFFFGGWTPLQVHVILVTDMSLFPGQLMRFPHCSSQSVGLTAGNAQKRVRAVFVGTLMQLPF